MVPAQPEFSHFSPIRRGVYVLEQIRPGTRGLENPGVQYFSQVPDRPIPASELSSHRRETRPPKHQRKAEPIPDPQYKAALGTFEFVSKAFKHSDRDEWHVTSKEENRTGRGGH